MFGVQILIYRLRSLGALYRNLRELSKDSEINNDRGVIGQVRCSVSVELVSAWKRG